jgi:hypothetical protein
VRCLLAVVLWVSVSAAFASAADHPDRARALDLAREYRYLDALPLLEQLAAAMPDDVETLEAYGMALLVQAATLDSDEARRQTRLRGRAALLRARDLGSTRPIDALLSVVPEDGSDTRFSAQPAIEAAIREGEAAFSRRDFDAALAAYQRALILDPRQYAALVFSGDVYYARKAYDDAAKWFARAVDTAPDRETAYRYWGDALLRQGRIAQARTRFIEAIVAEPYARLSWTGLRNLSMATRVQVVRPRVWVPPVKMDADGGVTISADPSQPGTTATLTATLAYANVRTAWRKTRFAEVFPGEATYRHSLSEEVEALTAAARIIRGMGRDPNDVGVANLIKLESAALLPAHVLLLAANADIARDYLAYRASNRDKLRQYLDEFLIPPTPSR